MIWNPTKECMSREQMRELQGKRLHKIVEYVYHNVPFYRNKLQEMDLSPADIQTIDDIVKLPFTTKKDLRDNYPFGLQAAPQSEIIRIHASSGTTGNPTIVGYTRKDISIWSECMARSLTSFGVTRNDIFSVSYGYGLFTGGLGAHNGVETIGASVVPTSPVRLRTRCTWPRRWISWGLRKIRSVCAWALSAPSRGRKICVRKYRAVWA